MGGDDSQKLLPWRGTHSSPGRSKHLAQNGIHTLLQRLLLRAGGMEGQAVGTRNLVFSLQMPNAGIPEVATYIAALSNATSKTRRAEDRSRYRGHLAMAALVFERLEQGDLLSAKQLVADERRSFGQDFLDGEAGANAESAFSLFAKFIEHL